MTKSKYPAPTSIRIPVDLQSQLEIASVENERSVNGEILFRLKKSFEPSVFPSSINDVRKHLLGGVEFNQKLLMLLEEESIVQKFNELEPNRNRYLAVLDAYWNGTPEDSTDFDILHDCLIASGLIGKPTRLQIKSLLFSLPDFIVFRAFTYGFNDAEVREGVETYVQSNQILLKERI